MITTPLISSGKYFKTSFSDTFTELSTPAETTILTGVKSIINIYWAVNAAGYMELLFDDTTPVRWGVLSGNGRWDFSQNRIPTPDALSGDILLSGDGFDNLDSYSIIIEGILR